MTTPFDVPTASDECRSDVLAGHTKHVRQFSIADSALIEPMCVFDAVGGTDMLAVMVRLAQEAQVAESVVGLLPIDVVDMLIGQQWPSDMLRHDPTVFIHLPAVYSDDAIAGRIQTVGALAVSMTGAATEDPLIPTQSRSLPVECRTTELARERQSHAPQNTMPFYGWQEAI
jgi:hypothetical protein